MMMQEITIKGKIDLTKSEAWANGLCIGEGTGEMEMILKDESGEIMKVKLHRISFEGSKSVTDPNQYPGSREN